MTARYFSHIRPNAARAFNLVSSVLLAVTPKQRGTSFASEDVGMAVKLSPKI